MNFRRINPRVLIPYPIIIQNPYVYEQHNLSNKNEEHKDQRFIPFVGGALIGGVLGSAYSRPRYYPYPVYGGYIPYYQTPGYYSVSSYNYGGYPYQQTSGN